MIAFYVSAVSAALLVFQAILQSKATRNFRRGAPNSDTPLATASPARKGYLQAHGGWVILSFQVLRFLANAALFSLSLAFAIKLGLHGFGGRVAILIAAVRVLDLLENLVG